MKTKQILVVLALLLTTCYNKASGQNNYLFLTNSSFKAFGLQYNRVLESCDRIDFQLSSSNDLSGIYQRYSIGGGVRIDNSYDFINVSLVYSHLDKKVSYTPELSFVLKMHERYYFTMSIDLTYAIGKFGVGYRF